MAAGMASQTCNDTLAEYYLRAVAVAADVNRCVCAQDEVSIEINFDHIAYCCECGTRAQDTPLAFFKDHPDRDCNHRQIFGEGNKPKRHIAIPADSSASEFAVIDVTALKTEIADAARMARKHMLNVVRTGMRLLDGGPAAEALEKSRSYVPR